jgi:hypothetical protein
MRRALLVATLIAGSAQVAGARDMNGRVGIGGAMTLGGVRGFDVMYWAGRMAVNGTINFLLFSPSCSGFEVCPDSGFGIELAAGLLFPLISTDSADLSFGGRIDLAARKDMDPQFDVEAPLRIEWYASEHFSVHGEVGVAVEIVGDKGRLLVGAGPLASSGGGTGFILGGTFVTAGGGFSVYF